MLKDAFGRPFLIFALLAAVMGGALYWRDGAAVIEESVTADIELLGYLILNIPAALLVGAFVQALLPKDYLSKLMGKDSGLKGIAISATAGAFTPGGPITSFPLVTVLRDGGSGTAALVSYITSWSTLGMQRILVWELPLMGVGFAAIRFIASLPLPLIAGLLTRLLPPVEPEPQPGAEALARKVADDEEKLP